MLGGVKIERKVQKQLHFTDGFSKILTPESLAALLSIINGNIGLL
jgi:hypothetical protein